ncbi:MAG TPA: hypothetical protein VK893_10900 [Pyrinomonadaceae bacterium]|nr:hypothetical protein [Pyrinomonadaceae bacterium]
MPAAALARQKDLCLKLISLAKDSSTPWETRRFATLLAEHQILKLRAGDLETFDAIFVALHLKQPGHERPITSAVLKEGYSTTELRGFISEFQRKLSRLNRVHRRLHGKVHGKQASDAGVREFIELSRRECKLTLARYVFTPAEIVDRVLKQVRVSEGVKDIDVSQPRYVDTEIAHVLNRLPEFEAQILRRFCEGTKIYWVGDETSSAINSLVEYPLTTVVLVIKPPGSHFECEVKRAGRRGNPLTVVFGRNGNRVPASHRLDGGSMQWLLRYEASNGAKFSTIYRLVHGTEAPLPGYISRNTVFAVPARRGPAPAFRYFTDPRTFGEVGFREMRGAMKSAVDVLTAEEGENLPKLPGDLALTAEFLSHVAPAQAILCGTSSFRLDKLATYLSPGGAETYFKQYRQMAYTDHDARQFADELLDEVLGVYESPASGLDEFKNYETYLEAAFSVAENRQRADRIFLSHVEQIARVWGTLLGVRGQSRGESFVARNVGLRSVWEEGEWRVKLIFMDHDALSLPEVEHGHFFAQNALPGILLDERHVWGRANPALFPGTLAGCLQRIYRIDASLEQKAQALAVRELKAAYQKTQRALASNTKLRGFFNDTFLGRLFDWDEFVAGYLNGRDVRWQSQMKQMFADKGYEPDTFDTYAQTVEKHKGFFERNGFLFER